MLGSPLSSLVRFFPGNDFFSLLFRDTLAFTDLVAFLATAETILILPEIPNECQLFFVFVVVLMPLVGPDRSVSFEKSKGILQCRRISVICRIRIEIRICQGRF